jgi:hypothetical protein
MTDDIQSPAELWASLSSDERAEVEQQIARSGESRDAWLLAYLRGERLLQRDVDDLDELWVAGKHAWDLIQEAHRQAREEYEADERDFVDNDAPPAGLTVARSHAARGALRMRRLAVPSTGPGRTAASAVRMSIHLLHSSRKRERAHDRVLCGAPAVSRWPRAQRVRR